MTTRRLVVSALLAATVLFTATAEGAVYHVSTGGSDGNSGLDWAHAKQTVTAALAAANEGDEIWVAAGTYHERVHSRSGTGGLAVNVGLYGGFAGTEVAREQRDWIGNVTLLDGDALGAVVTITSGAKPAFVVDGFRIRNGNAGQGGGISVLSSAPTIMHNDVLGNVADFGGGIMVWGYDPGPPAAQATLAFNVVQANFGNDGAGGIAIVGGSPVVRGNVIRLNGSYGRGGGIGVWISESALVARPVIEANVIQENAATISPDGEVVSGGGIFATERNFADEPLGGICAPRIRSNFVLANSGVALGGGIAIMNSENEPTPITNNTIVANSGSGIAWGNAGPLIVNNIVAYNTWGLDEDVGNPYAETVRSNDVYGNNVHGAATDWNNTADRTGVDGNVSVEPGLVNFGTGRLHLQHGSPCVDAGDDAAVAGDWVDIDQQPRTAGAHVDLGADESDGTAWPDVAVVLHVSKTGSDAQDGLTWATAMGTVQHAIDRAAQLYGAEVWVAEGTYVEHVTLAAWAWLFGGFAGTETARGQRDPAAHVTVLDGNEVPPVVNCGHAGYRVARLDGFRVTRGGRYYGGSAIPPTGRPAGLGGGIRCDTSSPVIAGNTIVNNSLGDPNTTTFEGAQGAGIGLLGSHALIVGNTITENEALARDGRGGGIYAEWSLPDVWQNTIYRNHAPSGPAMYMTVSRPRVFNNLVQENENHYLPPVYFQNVYGSSYFPGCYDLQVDYNVFYRNVAATGGALYVATPQEGRIENNVFRENRAYVKQTGLGSEGGAILLLTHAAPAGDVVINGNTFVGNTATDPLSGELGGAIAYIPYSSRVLVTNNAMAFNSSGIYRRSGATLSATLRRNGLWNGSANYVNQAPGTGDVVADPLFVDRASGNYRLAAASPYVDAGGNADAPQPWDLDGAPRIQDGKATGLAVVDIGAFEFSPDLDGDGTPDWRDPDDDGDGAPDDADCAPRDATVWNAPGEPGDVRVTGGTPAVVAWTRQDPGTRYDVAGGLVAELRADQGFARAACRADDLAAPPWSDTAAGPPAGAARWYAVRAANVCGTGAWGGGSDGLPRAIDACP